MAVTAELVSEVCDQYSGDGLSFRLLRLDDSERQVELGLVFDGVECMDCVMPTPYLERMIAASLTKRAAQEIGVKLHDPREPERQVDTAAPKSATNEAAHGGRVVVLDPTARADGSNMDSGPDANSLTGKTILFRVDVLWPSWDWIVDEWSHMLQDHGVEVRTWRRSQGAWGEESQRLQVEYQALIDSSHALISGLGNCGSCSVSTIEDALVGLNKDKPTLTVVTTHFRTLAHLLAENGGRPGLRIFELPHPLSQRPEDEVRDIARRHFPSMLLALGATV
jgi:hypothetical protein